MHNVTLTERQVEILIPWVVKELDNLANKATRQHTAAQFDALKKRISELEVLHVALGQGFPGKTVYVTL